MVRRRRRRRSEGSCLIVIMVGQPASQPPLRLAERSYYIQKDKVVPWLMVYIAVGSNWAGFFSQCVSVNRTSLSELIRLRNELHVVGE